MKQRLKKFDRIIKVQKHLHKNAELHLANLQRQESELKTAQEELLQTMSDRDVLHGLFTDVMAKRLKTLALEEVRTQGEIVVQKAVTMEKAMQVKRTEKVFGRIKEDTRRGQEKKDLAAILETMIQKSSTSLP
ncbi:hypothetical protein [Microvirga solisilvae]|uniref:hypothetical protein n=1 Tax=Microvirga solisilvae TaxID=2919498 RepID=UPI001FAEEB17|nr:hypothetical protein [Microvirga solisilvae]